jgi:hypothetical protein
MRRAILFLGALAILTACMPAETYNPNAFELAQRSQATAEAAQDAARFYGEQLTATAEAPIVHITETAAAFQVQQQAGQATQMVQATQTAGVATATAHQLAFSTTATAMQNEADLALSRKYAEQTAVANQVERDNLELERQAITNTFRALLSYLALIFAAVIIIVVVSQAVRNLRFRPIPRDARGDAIPLLDTVDAVVIDIDRNPNYASSTYRKDLPLLPPVTGERQDQVTLRDQLVDLATRGLPDGKKDDKPRKQLAAAQINQPRLPSGKAEILVIPANQALPVIKDVIPQIMSDSIDAEIVQEGPK